MLNRANIRSVYQWEFELDRHDFPFQVTSDQGGITCGAIDEPTKSSKAIDERVIINFRVKNVVIARFRDKNGGFIDSHSDQSIAIFFYR